MSADISKEKLQLIEWILKQEKMTALKPLTEIILALERDTADTNKIVGYRSRGVRVTYKELVQSLVVAINNLEDETLVGLEAIELQSDKW